MYIVCIILFINVYLLRTYFFNLDLIYFIYITLFKQTIQTYTITYEE